MQNYEENVQLPTLIGLRKSLRKTRGMNRSLEKKCGSAVEGFQKRFAIQKRKIGRV